MKKVRKLKYISPTIEKTVVKVSPMLNISYKLNLSGTNSVKQQTWDETDWESPTATTGADRNQDVALDW